MFCLYSVQFCSSEIHFVFKFLARRGIRFAQSSLLRKIRKKESRTSTANFISLLIFELESFVQLLQFPSVFILYCKLEKLSKCIYEGFFSIDEY